MKVILPMTIILLALTGCDSSKKKNHADSQSAEMVTPQILPPETADATFEKNGKLLARVVIEDNDSGVGVTFSAKKLEKGHYILSVEDSCKAPLKNKKKLPPKNQKYELGDFLISHGDTSLDFSRVGLSVGSRLIMIDQKSVTLNKVNKKGPSTRVACAKIVKR